jgi:PAS domain-containing protein
MQRFILQGNIARYQARLKNETDASKRSTLEVLLANAQRDLALPESSTLGTKPQFPTPSAGRDFSEISKEFLSHFKASPNPYLIIDPGPGLKIVDANDAYCEATMVNLAEISGRPLFEVFPDNPQQGLADGVSNLFQPIRHVFETRAPHEMAIQRYDIRDRNGVFQKRYWKPVNSPLFDQYGVIKLILHHVEDVTGKMEALPN